MRIRLAAEEVLQCWEKSLGEDARCTILYSARFGQRRIRLAVSGAKCNPNQGEADADQDAADNSILERLGLAPSFQYEKGVNRVTFQLPSKKPNQLALIGLAALVALVLGFASLSLPGAVRAFLTEDLASPVLQMLLGALTGVAMPLVFFSICISIMDIGDVVTLGKLGKKLIPRFLGWIFAVSALSVAAIACLGPLASGGSGDIGGFQTVLSMVLAVVPTNILAPFLDSNTLQLIFLGVCVGVAFLLLGERAAQAADVFRQLDRVVGLLMSGLNRLIPFFVFLTFFILAASGTITRLGGAVKIVCLSVLLFLAIMLFFTAAMSLRLHLAPHRLVRKMGPAFLVALSTASSMASYPIRLKTCEKRLGVDGHTARFVVPLAQALFKPVGCVQYAVSALCVAQEYGVSITLPWLMLCVVMVFLLSIATPPIPGGTKIAYAALLHQLGIPAEGLMLILAADAVLDFLATAANTYSQMSITALCADRLSLLDHTVLTAPDQPLE
ncbi:MAG: cation:dicarboxylase symporter family transporter [Clostridia bacterium]